MAKDFLVELGTEELPPKALLKLSQSFATSVESSLKEVGLNFDKVTRYATPRRLALVVEALQEQTEAKDIVVWGPPKQAAFDKEGNPTKAAEGFARKNGVSVAELAVDNDGKADKLVFRTTQPGKAAAQLLPGFISKAFEQLPIPKRMRWGASRNEFVRPVHWLVMMYGSDVINSEILSLSAGNTTRGHRFHCDTTLEIANPAAYPALLKDSGHVIPSFEERRDLIEQQVLAAGKTLGGEAVIDVDLLDEVCALVEWPVALTGGFEERFLSVPDEALISSMAEHQKYFHVQNSEGKLLPHFITVSNIQSVDPKQVISGNERVIRPRLSDAAFFFETDKKTPLIDRVEKLGSVIFQAKLGSVKDKSERIANLAALIAEKIGCDQAHAKRAGLLAKADLVSDMVLEFDKMQGIAGMYYAQNDGEAECVAEAIKDHYLPKFSGDKLPESAVGCAVALADRLDTLTGIFGIGQAPTGSKDPFALRRASLAVLRIIIEKQLNLDLRDVLELAVAQHQTLPAADGLVDTVLDYMLERFRAWYEEENISAEVFLAVAAKRLSHPLDIDVRVKAVNHFYQLPQAQALAAANKRVSNLLAKNSGNAGSTNVDTSLLKEAAEKSLAEALNSKSAQVAPLFENRDYVNALEALAELQQPVDDFFENVMVMADDEALKNNRIALLSVLRNLFLEVADISQLAPAK